MKHRLERVNALIQRELGEILARELEIEGVLVTVQDVSIAPDLKNAIVWIGVLGEKNQRGTVLERLEAKRREIQSQLAKRVILKFTPHLNFKTDDSLERGVRVNQILDELDIPEDKPNEP